MSLDITQDERAKMEDDWMIARTGKYMKCLNVDVAQPQVPPLKVTLPLECPKTLRPHETPAQRLRCEHQACLPK